MTPSLARQLAAKGMGPPEQGLDERPAKCPRVDAHSLDTAGTAATSSENAAAATATAEEPFLVLHFDVNKTIVMSDACQGYSVAKIVGEVLGKTTRGTVCSEKGWAWNGQEPSTRPEVAEHVSYFSWLRKQKLNAGDELTRLNAFGREGDPLAGISATRDSIEAALRLPNGEVGDSYRAIFDKSSYPSTQPWRYVVAPFFRLVQTLTARGRRFSIVIRTFGTDINNGLCREINAFAEGKHPLYPDAGRFDGSDGRPDLRISLDDPQSHGSFYRDSNGTHLVFGTLERPPPDNDMSEVGLRHFDGQGLRIVDGHEAIAAEIAGMTTRRGISALRDYWPWWGKANHEKGEAGKPIYVDTADFSTHPIFFDDHIATEDAEDAHIIDVRDTSGTPLPFSSVVGVHAIRSEPLDCLTDADYFVKWVDAAERRRRESRQ